MNRSRARTPMPRYLIFVSLAVFMMSCAGKTPQAAGGQDDAPAKPPVASETSGAPDPVAEKAPAKVAPPTPRRPQSTGTRAVDVPPDLARSVTPEVVEQLQQLKERRDTRPETADPDAQSDEPFLEHYLLKSPVLHGVLIDTYTTAEESDAAEPLFDALGEEAKNEYIGGSLAELQGYTDKALDHFLEAVEKDPENLWLKLRAGIAALHHNDFPRSQKLAQEVVDADPDNYTAILLLATNYSFRNKIDEARECYQRVLELKPRNLDALENMARIAYTRDNDLEKTKEYCSRILSITSQHPNALLWNAEACALTGDVEVAAEFYAQLVRYRPSLIKRLSDMGIKLLRMGRVDDSLALYRQGIVMAPDVEGLRLRWETILEEMKGPEAVHEAYVKLCNDFSNDLAIQELYADYLTRQGDINGLVIQRKRMLEINPEHVPSLLSLAKVSLAREDTEKANEYFELAIQAGPENASTYRDIALVYMAQEDYERAETLLTEAALLDPSDPETMVAMAQLAEALEDPAETERLLKNALDLSPANEKILSLLADFYYREGRLDTASQVYEQVLAVTPTDAQAYLKLALLYLELDDQRGLDRIETMAVKHTDQPLLFFIDYGALVSEFGEWKRAVWSYEKAIERIPENLPLRNDLARAYLHLGERDLAEKALVGAKEYVTEENETFYRLSLAHLYSLMGEHKRALAEYRTLSEADAESIELRGRLIGVLLKLDRQDEAAEELNDAVRDFAPAQPTEVKLLRASYYEEKGDTERAIGILLPVLNDDPGNDDVRLQLANLYISAEDVKAAEYHFTRLIEAHKDNPESKDILVDCYNNLAYAYAQAGTELDRAEELVNKAMELEPRAGYILDTLGWIKFKKQEYEESEKWLTKAEKLSLENAEILEHLGDLYTAMDRLRLAREYYERALNADPLLASAHTKLEELTLTMEEGNEATAP